MTDTATQLRERLRNVEDPVLGADIVSLGLVEDIRIDDGVADITLAFNAPYAPDEMAIGDEIRDVVGDLGLDTSLSVSLSWHDPESPLPDVRNIVAVASGKGGVGKTTVATNLAVALSEAGARVGLLDADIYGPNAPQMIGIDADPGLTEDGTLVPPEAYGIEVISMAFLTREETDPAMLRGPQIDNVLTQLIEDVEWGRLDYLVVDLPPGTGDAQLTLMQTVPVTGAVIVTTPEDIALEDVRKGIRMFEDQGTPVLGVIENMSAFECPSCGDQHALYGSGGGDAIATEYDIPLLGEIPMVPDIRAGNDADGPPAALQDDLTDAFDTLGDVVANRVGAVNRAEAAGLDPSDPDGAAETPSGEYLGVAADEGDRQDIAPSEGDGLDTDTSAGDRRDTGTSESTREAESGPTDTGGEAVRAAEVDESTGESSTDDDDTDEDQPDSDTPGGLDITE